MIDRNHPFYRPLWLRLALTGFFAGWTLLELFVIGSSFFGAISAALAIYFAWVLLITWKEPAP